MARISTLLTLSLTGLFAVGCVPMEKYTAKNLEARQSEEAANTARAEAAAARGELAQAKQQLETYGNSEGGMQGVVKNLNDRLAASQAENADLNRRYTELMNTAGKMAPPLSPALTSELSAFAQQNPDLVEFDAARGTVKFKSDVTFATGDAEVTPAARTAIARFAQILNSQAASSYELLVAGHTDNVAVRNPTTISKGHKNNWYLSAHRAISVADALMGDRVAPQRLGVLGYADQRPTASNGTDAGRAQNRRVEVMILPTQVRTNPADAPTTPGTTAKPAVEQNKDSAGSTPPAAVVAPEQNK